MKTRSSWPAGVILVLAFLTAPLVAARKPVEGKLEAFGGKERFELQQLFTGSR